MNVACLPSLSFPRAQQIRGLHLISGAPNALNLSRAILARHPNSDPEGAPFYINDAPSWISPASSQCDSAIVHQTNLPDNYPGMFQDFYLGVNGTCDMYQVDNSR